MNKFKFVLIVTLLGGCASSPTIMTVNSQFNEQKTKELLISGSNTIKGSALIRQSGGGIVSCAGNWVRLIPATLYAKERIKKIYGNLERGYNSAGFSGKKIKFTNTPQKYLELSKKTQCDTQGYFEFSNVSDGSFFVTTSILWKVNNYFHEGGDLMKKIDVSSGVVKNIVMSP